MTPFNPTYSYEHQALAVYPNPVQRSVPERPTRKHGRPFDRDMVTELAETAESRGEILFHLGVSRESWYFRTLAYTAWLYNIELPDNEGRPDGTPDWQDPDVLREAFNSSTTMQEVCEQFNLSPAGSTYERIRRVAHRLEVDLPEWAYGRQGRARLRRPTAAA
jgi:hypothetical protein